MTWKWPWKKEIEEHEERDLARQEAEKREAEARIARVEASLRVLRARTEGGRSARSLNGGAH